MKFKPSKLFDWFDEYYLYYLIELQTVKAHKHSCISTFEVQSKLLLVLSCVREPYVGGIPPVIT